MSNFLTRWLVHPTVIDVVLLLLVGVAILLVLSVLIPPSGGAGSGD